MGKVLRVTGVIVIILVPLLFVLAMLRYYAHGMPDLTELATDPVTGEVIVDPSTGLPVHVNTFLPDYATFVSWFSTFPDFSEQFRVAVNKFNGMNEGVCIPDFTDMFNPKMICYSNPFINSITGVFDIIWILLSAPFQVLGWFFSNFFAPVALS